MRKNIINLFLISFLLFSTNAKASSKKPLKFELQPRSHYVRTDVSNEIDDDTLCNALGLIEKGKGIEHIIRSKHLVIAYVVQKFDEKDSDSIEIAEELIREVDPSLWDMAIGLARNKK